MEQNKYFKIKYQFHNGSISSSSEDYFESKDETDAIVNLVDACKRKAKKLGHTYSVQRIDDIDEISFKDFDAIYEKRNKHQRWNNLLAKLNK